MNKEELIELMCDVFSSEALAPHKIKVLKIDDRLEGSFEVTFVALDYEGYELSTRDFKIRETFRNGWSVSHSTSFPVTDSVVADNIQHIIVGEMAKELLKINQSILA